jgi:hypothetical protein
MFLGLPDPHLLVRDTDLDMDSSIIMQVVRKLDFVTTFYL